MSEEQEPLFDEFKKREESELLLLRHDLLFLADNLGHVIERHKLGRNWQAPLMRLRERTLKVAERMDDLLDDGVNLGQEPQPPQPPSEPAP